MALGRVTFPAHVEGAQGIQSPQLPDYSGVHAASRHHFQGSAGGQELAQTFPPGPAIGGLTAGEDGVDSQASGVSQGFCSVPAYVEGPMEGQAPAPAAFTRRSMLRRSNRPSGVRQPMTKPLAPAEARRGICSSISWISSGV